MYGIYINSLDRFAVVDHDFWIVLHTSKLLSSKISSCVVPVSDGEITNSNCYSYGLLNPREANQDSQYPRFIEATSGEESKGPPEDVSLYEFAEDREFFKFVLDSVRASWLTEARLNGLHHEMFINMLGTDNLEYIVDDSGIPGGFKKSIDRELYTAQTVEEARTGFSKVFDFGKSQRPTNTEKYRDLFFRILDNE